MAFVIALRGLFPAAVDPCMSRRGKTRSKTTVTIAMLPTPPPPPPPPKPPPAAAVRPGHRTTPLPRPAAPPSMSPNRTYRLYTPPSPLRRPAHAASPPRRHPSKHMIRRNTPPPPRAAASRYGDLDHRWDANATSPILVENPAAIGPGLPRWIPAQCSSIPPEHGQRSSLLVRSRLTSEVTRTSYVRSVPKYIFNQPHHPHHHK